MPEPLLEVHDLVAGYGRQRVLNAVSMHVDHGEAFAVIGANGVGKTTLLGTLAGLVPAWSGSVRLAGVELARLPAHRVVRAGVTLVPEGRRVFTGLSVEENLLVGAHALGDGKTVRTQLERQLTRFPRLAERRTQPAGQLSGGEQQMLAIGRALMSRPRLLLLDEPSLGLAPLIVEAVLGALPEIRADGTAILLVEQNARLAFEVTDRAAVMQRGALELSGPSKLLAGDERVRALYLGHAMAG
jgi:branched-chain amino acid transport system ATP-binding protein